MNFRRKCFMLIRGTTLMLCLYIIFWNCRAIYHYKAQYKAVLSIAKPHDQLIRQHSPHTLVHTRSLQGKSAVVESAQQTLDNIQMEPPHIAITGMISSHMADQTIKDENSGRAKQYRPVLNLDNKKKDVTQLNTHIVKDQIAEVNKTQVTSAIDVKTPKDDANVTVNSIIENKLNQSKVENTPVLIVGYLRSGSSWLGDIIQQADEAFYMYEPFRSYQRQAYYKVGSVCYNNNTCRKSFGKTDAHSFVLFTILQLFACRFERVPQSMISTLRFGKQTRGQLKFSHCMKFRKNVTRCSNLLKKTCMLSKVKVIKTIRVSMAIVEKLAMIIPGLKVIHLFRDPRGITLSRQKGHFKMAYNLEAHSRNLCDRMSEDIDIFERLKAMYKAKFLTIAYEDMAEYPYDAIRAIYKFLDIQLKPSILNWLLKATHGNFNNGYYKTMRKDSSQVAYKWRNKLEFAAVSVIDSLCRDLYLTVGYVAVPEEVKLNDTDFQTRLYIKDKYSFA